MLEQEMLTAIRELTALVRDLRPGPAPVATALAVPAAVTGELRPVSSMLEWIEGRQDVSREYRQSLESAANRLIAQAGRDATIQSLPEVLQHFRKQYARRGQPSSFKHLRSYTQAFLRDTVGRGSPIYRAVADVRLIPASAPRHGHPLTVAEVIQLREMLPAPDWRATVSMCTTGMGPKEYFGRVWHCEPTWLHIRGTKREARVRNVPLVLRPALPQVTFGAYGKCLLRHTGRTLQPYDCRRTFANWMVEAGIPRPRRREYLGHAPSDVTDRYERPRPLFLEPDGKALGILLQPIVAIWENEGP